MPGLTGVSGKLTEQIIEFGLINWLRFKHRLKLIAEHC
jgi:hypothetical protein